MDDNIIVNVGDLVVGDILVGRCRVQTQGRGRGKKAKRGKAREGRIGQGETTLGCVWPVADSWGGSGSKLDLERD